MNSYDLIWLLIEQILADKSDNQSTKENEE